MVISGTKMAESGDFSLHNIADLSLPFTETGGEASINLTDNTARNDGEVSSAEM